jgi:septal ring factor EnvC (AmiA/AmiB activator)
MSRALPILNALGCLILTGLVILQWNKERRLNTTLDEVKTELSNSIEQATTESKRGKMLDQDIAVLKESLEIAQQANDATTRSLQSKETLANELESKLAAANAQLETWRTAIDARDEKLRALNRELTATRGRLDDAIAKLKASAAKE